MNLIELPYIKFNPGKKNLLDNIEDFYVNNGQEKTLEHVKSVAKTNAQIAAKFHLDKEKCYLGGLLHDISAVVKPDDMMRYAKKRGWSIDQSEKKYPFLLHQQISRILSEEVFGVEDIHVLSPIQHHTTLKSHPTSYDMALFIADKLSWDQEGVPPFFDKVNHALSTSLEAASLEYISYVMKNGMILYPHQWLLDAREYLSGCTA